MKTSDDPIVVKQSFKARSDTVWKALTEVDLMRQWYFDNIPAFKPEIGFATSFMVQSGGRDFLHMWKVTEAVPRKRISYEWRFQGFPGESTAVFEVIQKGMSTILRLTVTVGEDFPGGIPEFERNSCIEGWKYFINERLKEFLERNR